MSDQRGQRRDEPRLVLVVGVHHHDDIRAGAQRLAVAGLLVGAVARVDRVADRVEAEALGDGEGGVVARIVDQHHVVDHVAGNRAIARRQRALGTIGGHDDDDALSVDHDGFP
ncbi:MAG: hypothetical protein U1F10_15230 [Burkholderiales bacterium]